MSRSDSGDTQKESIKPESTLMHNRPLFAVNVLISTIICLSLTIPAFANDHAELMKSVHGKAAKEAALSSQKVKELPPGQDREWVEQQAALSLSKGKVNSRDLAQHVDELASLRKFKVIEREEPYLPDSYFNSEEGQ